MKVQLSYGHTAVILSLSELSIKSNKKVDQFAFWEFGIKSDSLAVNWSHSSHYVLISSWLLRCSTLTCCGMLPFCPLSQHCPIKPNIVSYRPILSGLHRYHPILSYIAQMAISALIFFNFDAIKRKVGLVEG